MEKKLQKPTFTKVKNLENCQDGYNVYVKVVSVQQTSTRNGEQQIARAVVGDETGIADAFFKGENVKLINKGDVIAIRNGRVQIIKSHILLEVDIFGRITKQNIEIKVDSVNNISAKEITRKKTRPRPRDGDRDGHREGNRDRGHRDGNRDNKGHRQPREHRENRGGDRGDNRRPPRKYSNQKQGRRPNNNRREEDNRRPRYENRPKREEDTNKPRTEWTKIGAIEPGDDGLNLFAKIVSVEPVGKRARVVFGDESGIVKGFVYADECISEGNTVVIFKAEANVNKQHIELQIMKGGKIESSKNRKINDVDDSVDISEKAWVESA